tara:strand:- start:193 stop:1116 length:924 start_codon:yes stop_codon:yes gene_type:complete
MDLYSLKGNNLTSLEQKPFKKEKEIQDLVEKNTKELFGVQFVSSEFTIDEFRIDTLCFDDESKSFVIIEYKKGSSYSVIDQGYSYLSKMLNNKDSFVLEYCKKKKVSVDIEIDWSQSRIIFVSPSFNSYQKNSVNFQDIPFELWEIKRFSNDSIVLNQHLSQSNQSIKKVVKGKNNVIDKVNREVKIYSEDYHKSYRKNTSEEVIELYDSLRNKILDLGDIEIRPRKEYIGFISKTNFVDIRFQTKNLWVWINLKSGEVDDPKKITRDVSEIGHYGNGDYEFRVYPEETDLDYVIFLIKQSFLKHQK